MKCPRCMGTGKLTPKMVHYGDMIMARRVLHGKSRMDLAKMSGLSESQIANIESGQKRMTLESLEKFAKTFSCAVKDLIPDR